MKSIHVAYRFFLVVWGILGVMSAWAQKQVYIPRFITNAGINLNDPNSQWSYSRSVQTDNWIIFWEPGFGADPSTAPSPYRVDMNALKQVAERAFAVYVDSLRMVIRGSSLTDQYKQMIFILYSTEWAAYGSGQDDRVGTLHVNPAAANINTVLAHEIGHCFEYMAGSDSRTGGFRYGFGPNASGGNGYWEQVAQWLSFKVYPAQQFTAGDFNTYIRNNHLHILHETPRYANYFLPDYWAYKRGPYFQGRLWRESLRPEDPVEAYKRLNSISQAEFNAEMYEHAARLTTWDLPALRSYGANYINRRPQVKMNAVADGYWQVDSSVTIENYGYNSIQLNAPSAQTIVSVHFRGMAGAAGYRKLNVEKAGWRFGFVALLNDGNRVYSDMGSLDYAGGKNPEGSLSFMVPANCSRLWFVVSGAPQEHWRHAWDDDNSNDEQWPYQVKFSNTNLLGQPNLPAATFYALTVSVEGQGMVSPSSGSFAAGTTQSLTAVPAAGYLFAGWGGDASGTQNPLQIVMNADKQIVARFAPRPVKNISYSVTMAPRNDYTPVTVALQTDTIARFFGLTAAQIASGWGSSVRYYAINPDGTLDSNSTAVAPGHWFDSSGRVVAYGVSARVFSELSPQDMIARIGQYPGRSRSGDSYTVRQALIYYKSANEVYQVNLVFRISVTDSPVLSISRAGHSPQIFWTDAGVRFSLENPARLEIYGVSGTLLVAREIVGSGQVNWAELQIPYQVHRVALRMNGRLFWVPRADFADYRRRMMRAR